MEDADRGQVVAGAALVYEEFFVPALFGQWPERVLDSAGIEPGHRVLDVGCGTGILARAAARRVGPTGRVVGVDPNEGMLSVARQSPEPVEWRTGVAEQLPLGTGSFDRVLSQFAAMFFTDPGSAFGEMVRVLAPGGTVAIATWASLDEIPGYAAMVDLLDDLLGAEAADALRAPFVLGDPDALRGLLAGGFPQVTVELHEGTARFDSIEAWVHTDIRGWTLADTIDDDQYETLLRVATDRLGRFADESGRVSFPAPALIAVART
jgi:SAM-dependent methyltransferase